MACSGRPSVLWQVGLLGVARWQGDSVYLRRPRPVRRPRASVLNSATEPSRRRPDRTTVCPRRSRHRPWVRPTHSGLRQRGDSRKQFVRRNLSGCPGLRASRRWQLRGRTAARPPRSARCPPPVRRRRTSGRRPVSSVCSQGRSMVSCPPRSASRRCPWTRSDRCRVRRVPGLPARWEPVRVRPPPPSGSPPTCQDPRRKCRCRHSAAAPWRCVRWARRMPPGRSCPRPGCGSWQRRGVRRPRRRRPVRRCWAPDSSRRSGRTRTPLVKAELFELDGQPNGRRPARSGISPRRSERTLGDSRGGPRRGGNRGTASPERAGDSRPRGGAPPVPCRARPAVRWGRAGRTGLGETAAARLPARAEAA